MTTIFTDDFCRSEIDISVEGQDIGHDGVDLIFANTSHEVRLRLDYSQLNELAEALLSATGPLDS